jgi:hypothetical protein
MEALPPFVIPTGAYPDFLPRCPHQCPRVRLSVKESRMKLANATNLDRKSGVAEWRDLRCAFPERNCPSDSLPSTEHVEMFSTEAQPSSVSSRLPRLSSLSRPAVRAANLPMSS